MKKTLFLILALCCSGCATTRIPAYIQDTNPYVKRFPANFDVMDAAVRQTLADMGWTVEETTDPVVYEQDRINDLDEKQELILTTVRQTAMFLGTRYAKMNVYVRSKNEISEVELRYVTITVTPVKTLTSYRNDSAAQRIFDHIEKLLLER